MKFKDLLESGNANPFTVAGVKELVIACIKSSDNPRVNKEHLWKIARETDTQLFFNHKTMDAAIDFNFNMHPTEIFMAAIAKIETSSVSLADPRLNYQNTSARRVTHKKVNIRDFFEDMKKLEKKIKAYLSKLV